MVAKIFFIKFFPFYTKTQGGDQGLNFGIFVDFSIISLLDIQDFAAQGQDGLKATIPTLLSRTAGGIPFDDINLRLAWIPGTAIRQLARQS